MQNFIELRVYAGRSEKICYDFQPIKRNPATDWNPAWEDWHSYPEPLRIYLTDFEKLLRNYILPLFPTADAFDGSLQTAFDPCFDNWLSVSDYQKLIAAIETDTIPPEHTLFYEQFIAWLKHALQQADIIIIESNL